MNSLTDKTIPDTQEDEYTNCWGSEKVLYELKGVKIASKNYKNYKKSILPFYILSFINMVWTQ